MVEFALMEAFLNDMKGDKDEPKIKAKKPSSGRKKCDPALRRKETFAKPERHNSRLRKAKGKRNRDNGSVYFSQLYHKNREREMVSSALNDTEDVSYQQIKVNVSALQEGKARITEQLKANYDKRLEMVTEIRRLTALVQAAENEAEALGAELRQLEETACCF